jgi:hypothetical protein
MFRQWMSALVARVAARPYVRAAIADKADLSAFRQRPSLRVITGMALILVSYAVGWPLVSLLTVAAFYMERPLVAAVGGPLVYGLSHLVFILGMYLSGAKYTAIFLRWATRKAMVKLQRRYPPPSTSPEA